MTDTVDRAPFKVRASSWGSLFDCAHRWEGTHLMKLHSPSGARAALGTAIHAGTAHFDSARVNGYEPSTQDAGEAFLDALNNPREEVNWRADDLKKKDAERIGLTLVSRYCADVAPKFHYVAVEMETKPLIIDCGGGVKIQLTGTMDRARAIADEYGVRIADVKTGSRAVETDDATGKRVARTKGHGPQIGTYELLYEHTTGEQVTGPGEIIGMHTHPTKPEIAVAEIKDARRLLTGTETSPGLIEYAAVMFRTGMFPPNPSSVLCSKKYCARWATCTHHY